MKRIFDLTTLVEKLRTGNIYQQRFESFYPVLNYLNNDIQNSICEKGIANTFIIGVLGPQGSGKSSLTRHFCECIHFLTKLKSETVSIDDFYLSYLQRKECGIRYRGPPGTHNLQDMTLFFDSLQTKSIKTIAFPRFDKSIFGGQGDRIDDVRIQKPDVLFFEGWFVGMLPLENLETEANEKLKLYTRFWKNFRHLIVLQPDDFKHSYVWREEAESKFEGKGMPAAEIRNFVDFFFQALDPNLYYPYLKKSLLNAAITSQWIVIDKKHALIHLEFIEKKDIFDSIVV